MEKTAKNDEKLRALRKELSQRTINMLSRGENSQNASRDPDHVRQIGREISQLIRDEYLEEARARLEQELQTSPDELGFLNLLMIINVMDRKFGDFSEAKKLGSRIMELAVEQDNMYYTMAAINNMSIVAHNEGHDEISKVMYLAAHFIDRRDVGPMRNLAGWHARRNRLEEAQKWIDKLIETYPDWHAREEITTFLKKDESLYNLRTYEPFRQKILAKLEKL